VKGGRIWGCERAYARSHPQIRVSTTEFPKEPQEFQKVFWENKEAMLAKQQFISKQEVAVSFRSIFIATHVLILLSVDHETIKRSPKTGVRAPEGDCTPVFGYPLNFCEALIM